MNNGIMQKGDLVRAGDKVLVKPCVTKKETSVVKRLITIALLIASSIFVSMYTVPKLVTGIFLLHVAVYIAVEKFIEFAKHNRIMQRKNITLLQERNKQARIVRKQIDSVKRQADAERAKAEKVKQDEAEFAALDAKYKAATQPENWDRVVDEITTSLARKTKREIAVDNLAKKRQIQNQYAPKQDSLYTTDNLDIKYHVELDI